MNKDNLVFAVMGILVGLIGGYMMHEVMASRQPPRLTPELRAQIALPGEQPAQMGQVPPPQSGDPAQAGGSGPMNPEVQALVEHVKNNPNDADAVLQLANLNFGIRDWPRAEELYRHYLTLRPNDPDVMTDLGVTLRETRRYDQALALFREVHRLAPDNWMAYYNEVVVLAFDLKRLDEANQILARLQQMQPGNPEVAKLTEMVARQRNAA